MGGLYFIGKLVIERWFKAREQAYEYELRILSQRDNIRYSKLHEDRAKVIFEAHQLLVAISGLLPLYLNKKNADDQDRDLVFEAVNRLVHFVDENEIYFSESLAKKLSDLSHQLQGVGFSAYLSHAMRPEEGHKYFERNNAMAEAATNYLKKLLDGELSPLISAVKAEFRALLGVDDKTKY